MKGFGQKTSRKQEAAITALITTATYKEAAAQAGLSETSLWRLLQQPEFIERYRGGKRQIVTQTVKQLQQASVSAVATLITIMKDSASRDSARVAAARCVLELTLRASEMEMLQEKLEAAESKLSDWENEKDSC